MTKIEQEWVCYDWKLESLHAIIGLKFASKKRSSSLFDCNFRSIQFFQNIFNCSNFLSADKCLFSSRKYYFALNGRNKKEELHFMSRQTTQNKTPLADHQVIRIECLFIFSFIIYNSMGVNNGRTGMGFVVHTLHLSSRATNIILVICMAKDAPLPM